MIKRRRRYPSSLRDERGELDMPEGAPQPPRGPVRSSVGVHMPAPEILKGGSGLNLPGVDSGVMSVYDVRPINARDFIAASIVGDLVAGAQTFFMDVRVPQGYVMVVKEFSYQIGTRSGAGIFTPESDIQVTQVKFFVDGIEAPYQLPVESGSGAVFTYRLDNGQDRQKTFILALPNSLVRFQAVYVGALSDAMYAALYGQLLLYRGMPLQFETGSSKAGA